MGRKRYLSRDLESVKSREKPVPGGGARMCKGPVVVMSLRCLNNRKKRVWLDCSDVFSVQLKDGGQAGIAGPVPQTHPQANPA